MPYLQLLLPLNYLTPCLRCWTCKRSYRSFPGTWGAVKWWLRHRNLTRYPCPECSWASLEAIWVHAVHIPKKKLEEPPWPMAPCETLRWYVEPRAGLGSELSFYPQGHSPVVLQNVLLSQPGNDRIWYMAVLTWFCSSARKMSSNFTSSRAIPVQLPMLSAAALAKQTSALSCSPSVTSQILSTVLELPAVLFHCVILHLPNH